MNRLTHSNKRYGLLITGLMVIAVLAFAFTPAMPGGVDWYESLRPAMENLVTGHSPYAATSGLHINATGPWGLLVLSPLLLFSPDSGRNLLFVISLIGFCVALYRLKALPVTMALFLVSPPVLHSLLNANIDWLPILGFTLRPGYGIFLIALKPQMGSVVMVVWGLQIWSQGGFKALLTEFLPFTVVLLLSVLIYGPWFLESVRIAEYSQSWNASLWPMSIPVGLLLLTHAIKRLDIKSACVASPCLSPYVLFHAWSGALSALAENPLYMGVTVVGLWILVILRA